MRRDGVANKERIMQSAQERFASEGIDASTEDIARGAGVGVATVFRHFPTKQKLIEATAVRFLEHMEAETLRIGGETGCPRAFESVFRYLISSGGTKLALANLLPAETDGLPHAVTAALKAFRLTIGNLLANAQASGAIRDSVTADDLLTLVRALSTLSRPEDRLARDRAVGIVFDALSTTPREVS
jgi:AcrR family transcriptional regulator